MSQERKFARTVSKPGMAAQVRVTVAQAVRQSTSMTKPKLVEPIDFETFLLKNKTILQNDPQRELVLFPSDDVSQEILPRRYRTLIPSLPPGATEDASHLFVQECIKSYTNNWNIIHYKYSNYGKDYWDLPKTKSKPENLPEQVYELDEDIESKDEENSISNGVYGETITKKGILYKCTQSGNSSIISLGTKSFKRRYAYLRRQVDGTYMLEFCKVDKKNESKGAIYLDFYSAVAKSVKKGKFAFELKLADTGKDCLLAAESEEEMTDWISTLKTIILETHSNKLQDRISMAAPPSPSLSERDIGTMRESLEQSMNPELVKYARETDQSLSQARKENRQQLFGIYPEMQRSCAESEKPQEKLEPYKECFGFKFMVKCENLNFRLQTKTNDSERGCCQVEPFFTSMALYDMKLGKKISEEFRFDMNNSHMRAMLPRERLPSSESSQPNGLSHKPCFPDLGHLSEDWLRYPSQGIFSVLRPDSDIYLVVRIEKVLQGSLAQSVDPYLRNGDPKLGLKVYKVAKTFCNRLGHYRMPFGWAAKPVFRPSGGDLDTDPYINTIYKCESSRISDEDLIKFLSDFKKQEKISKLQIIPGQIKLTIEPFKPSHPNILTSSLVPVRPFPDPPTHALSLEIEEFGPETGSTSYPFTTYTNNLYVYPKSLKYDNQKTFTKARNIACVVEFRDNDEEGSQPLKKIYSRPGMPVFSTCASAAVLHHNSCPEFYEEVKIALPTQLTEKHHVLFTFYHVSCDQAKGTSKRREQIETVVGFSWLPVLYKGRVNIQEHSLTVAAHLPPGYLSCQHLGLGKGFTMPDVRWVDGGKQLFRVEFKLASTIYTKDQHMHNFFAHCQRIRSIRSPSSDSETSKFLKTLHAVEVSTFILFAPTILNQLLKLLPYATNEDVSLNIIRVIIHFVHESHIVGKSDVLRAYVKYVFLTENTNNRNGINYNTVHEELAKSLTVTLRPANADVVIINKFLKHAWFIFGILTKSMAQYLLSTGRIKMYRNERFSPDYQYRIQNLLQALMSHIIQKFKEIPDETRHANRSLAEFVKNCFLFMDRGFVFRLINLYLDRFNPGDPKALCELKFEFLQIVCNHEYFIPLNLPLCSGSAKGPKNFKDMEQLYRLSDEFCKNHFLVGSLLQEVKSALNELNETRKCAITVLRNLLAKHAFDDRYQNASQQARIASLYLPFLSIILENVYRLNNKDGITTCPSMITNESVTPEIPPTPVANHRHTISLDNSISNLNSFKMSRESSFFALTAGQIANGNLPYLQLGGGSDESLSSNSSTVTLPSNEQDKPELKERNDSLVMVKSARSESKSHTRNVSQSFSQNPLLMRYDKLDQQEVKDLLVCLLYILKNISEELMIGWWQHCNEYDILDFFHVLEICLYTFRYIGKKQICSSSLFSTSNTTKAMTLPARKAISFMPPRNASLSAKNPTSSYPSQVDAEALYRALLEANMATEVGLITLDVLGLYCNEFKIQLQYQDGDNTIMRKVFDIYISFLQVGQSETLLKHVFAALRSFINKFPTVLFKGNALICGTLCYEILKCCNSRLTTTRHEACALLYLLMRSNFEFASKKNFTRVHLQVIISVSQLLGDIVGLINSRFQESLSLINNYANSDKAMKSTAFPKEVKDLTKRIRTVLMATAQMKEHENDPEMLVDLQYSLANSYASTPELRRTWLESMARIHVKNGEMSEAAHCYIHIAALVAEYLKIKGLFPEGCWAFQEITSNVQIDESNMKEDSGMQDIHYTEETLLEKLELCAEFLGKAERYEDMSKIYRLIIPIHERHRNFQALAEVYKTLHTAYSKIVELTRTGRRLLGKYYRIAFFGQAYLEDEKEKEYIYKEPKVTTLAEISEKLLNLYTEKFGQGTVKLIQDSKQVDTKELDPKYLYIQVTHVTPYFTEDELDERLTDFEKNNNINKFMFETPFTLDGLRARGSPEEQCKRRTILTSAYSFPYVKKRIPVLSRQVYELSPIEVAIDEMETRVGELNDVINTSPPDLKKLQLKLQGSVSVTVNSGPLTYASIFLEEKNVHKYPREKIRQLKEIYRKFVQACSESLDLNGRLISADQFEYQEAMKRNFKDLVDELSGLLHDKVYNLLSEDRVSSLNRTSLTLFNYISGTPGSSAV